MEGNKALREGRWAEAIDFFTRAESLVHAPPHLLYMARAQIEVGMLVAARENLMRVSRESLAPDAPRAFKVAQEEAMNEIKAVEARIPYVTVTVKGGGASDFTVTQDGNRIPSALIGVPRPVDPGQHSYEASGPGGLKATASITIKEAERQRVILDMKPGGGGEASATTPPKTGPGDASKPKDPQPGSSASPPPTEGKDTGPAPAEPDSGGMNGMRLGSYISFGVGALGLVGGTIFSLGAKSKFDESNKLYKDNNCDAGCPSVEGKIKDLDSSASGQKTLGIVGFIVGGLGIAGGVTLFILSGDKKEEAAGRAPALRVAASPGFVSLSGAF